MNAISWLSEKWQSCPVGTFEKRTEVYQWLLHNIIFGFAGVWIPFLALYFFGYMRIRESLLDGEIVMFAVTLSAVSLGFFVKETQINLRKKETLTYAGLMLIMFIGVIIRTVLAFDAQFPTNKLELPAICWTTGALVVLAVLLNFRLFTIELDSIDRKTFRDAINKPVQDISDKAKDNNQVDNIRL